MDANIANDINDEALSGILSIDLKAISANYELLASRASPATCGAVVKANAYGLGADRVAPTLAAAGCRHFFVAHLVEAKNLKRHLPRDAKLFVLNGLLPGGEAYAAGNGIIPVINCLAQMRNWSLAAEERSVRLPAVLQFDTGMSRLGLSAADAAVLLQDRELLRNIDVQFIMSHLASADESLSPQNGAQLATMQALAAQFPEAKICFANSGGIFLGGDFHGAMVRPGIALYGGGASDSIVNPMKPVVNLSVRVVQTHTVPAGTLVGYGGSHRTASEMRLATLAAGYADGLPRSLSDRGAAYAFGKRLPIIGRVSMDSMTVDISALPAEALDLGSLVELIGPHQSLEDIARDAGTISYEILTGLGQRYHRQYI
jgi:alanine racemase